MVTRNSDVNLVVRARTEGEKTIAALGETLQNLYGDAAQGSHGLADLARTVGLLDKAFGSSNTAADKAEAALARLTKAAADTKAKLAELKAQDASATSILSKLRGGDAIVDAGRSGPAQSQRLQQIKDIEQAQTSLRSQIKSLSKQFGDQSSAVETAKAALVPLGLQLREISAGQAEATAQIKSTTQALKEQAVAAEHVSETQARINAVTGVSRPSAVGSAAASASILIGGARLPNENSAIREAAALRAQLNPLAAEQERLNTQLARYKQLAAAGVITTKELAAAESHLAAEAKRAEVALSATGPGRKLGLFGLKPYELQNLGYQVNDVVTQLASGTKLSQVLAQQGGQILQLFPKVGGAIVSALSNPYVLAAAAAFGVLTLGIKSAADQAERLRHYTSTLAFRADGKDFSASDLSNQEHALKALGNSADDARAAVTTFIDSGIAPDKLGAFAAAAQNLADIMGIKLPDAATQVATAFSGGYDAVAKLDDKLNFLTATEREHIRVLFESGHASDARTEAFNIFQRKANEVAQDSRGPWADATRSLEKAWSHLTETLGNTAWAQAAIDAVNLLASAIDRAAGGTGELQSKIDGLGGGAPGGSPGGGQGAAIAGGAKTLVGTTLGFITGFALPGGSRTTEPSQTAAVAPAAKGGGAPAAVTGDVVKDNAESLRKKHVDEEVARLTNERDLQALRNAGEVRILSLREQNRRVELAGIEASRNGENDAVIAALRRNAVEKETAKISRETEARQKAAAAEKRQAAQQREAEIKLFEERAVGAEGGTAKNPYSSAKGYGQFVESTFLEQYKKIPTLNQNLDDKSILELRNNEKIAKAVLDGFTRENARFLEQHKQTVTAGNLYLAHFLGKGTALAVLQARTDAPVDEVIRRAQPKGAAGVLNGNQGYLRTENGKGRYRTAGELQTFISGRVGGTAGEGRDPDAAAAAAAEASAAAEQERIAKRNIERQQSLTYAVEQTNAERKRSIEAQQAESGLTGTALIDERRRQEVANAEYDLKKRAADANKNLQPGDTAVVVKDEEIAQAKELAGALFDEVHARERLSAQQSDAQRPVDDLQQQIGLLREEADWLRSIGDIKSAEAIDKQVVTLNGSLRESIAKLIEFYKALSPDQRLDLGIVSQAQFDNLIANLTHAGEKTQQFGKIAGLAGEDVARAFASSASQSFTNFIAKIAQGKNVFRSLGESVLEFAASFAGAIAQMIIQLLAYAAAVTILRALGVPVPAGGGGGVLGALVGKNHGGGMAGSAGMHRVNPAIFAGAMRFHTGGIVGLSADEVPIIARRDEEVLTASDPRHRNNGGLSGGGGSGVTVVNVNDHAQALDIALKSPAGEKVLINHVSENRAAFKAALGG